MKFKKQAMVAAFLVFAQTAFLVAGGAGGAGAPNPIGRPKQFEAGKKSYGL